MNKVPLLLATALLPLVACAAPREVGWPEETRTHRPGLYWWIPGSAMDEANMTWNLETLREAGFGGMSMVLIYGVKGEESRYLDFLSPRWIEMFAHTAREAERLDLWLDLTPGGGWRLGGPEIEAARSEQRIAVKEGRLSPAEIDSRVKRAGPGATGRAINPYSREILLEYLTKFDAVFSREDVPAPRAFYHDSFEYRGNWCDGFLEEFAARRGYDLREQAAALEGEGDPELVGRVRHDYRETLNDLHLECVATLADWAEGYGATVRQQAHGSPTNLLDAYALCGVPETEVFGANVFGIPGLRREPNNVRADRHSPLVNRLASSAAHVGGRNLVASETCTWIRNHFRTALSQVKPEVDKVFLAGVNHLFFHGCCYSPQDAEWPGWLFYASLQCNPRNAFWRDVPTLTAYVARCQSILQGGQPDGDVLLYWPIHDLWSSPDDPLNRNLTVHSPEFLEDSSAGRVAKWLVGEGYSFDFVSDALLQSVEWRDGRLRAHGAAWSTAVVPAAKHVPLATLDRLIELAACGAPVIFLDRLPADVPGLDRLEERRTALQAQLASPEADRVMVGDDLESLLAALDLHGEPMKAAGLEYVRRRHEDATHYFVVNQGAEAVDGWIPLARPAASVVLLDPMTGRIGEAPLRGFAVAPEVRLQLHPGESRILYALTAEDVAVPPWPVVSPSGERRPVEGTWSVEFLGGGPVLPAHFTTAELRSWTELGDSEAERFAGTARYRIELELPAVAADRWRLDLGDVRESARVLVDGRPVGTLIAHPFTLDLDGILTPGEHVLEIEVTNLSANRIRDLDRRGIEWKRFHDINIVDHEYRRFDASDWPVSPSGLLGPVTLTPLIVDES